MREVKLLAVLVLTAGCLAWALWGIDLRGAWDAFRSFDARWLLAVLAGCIAILASRTARFWFLIAAPTRLADVLIVMIIGVLAINVVPFRMGELVRPYLLAESYGVPFGVGMAAVVLERLLDMLALLALLTYVAWFVDVPGGIVVGGVDLLRAGQRAMAGGVLVGALGVAFLAIAGPYGVSLVSRVVGAVAPPLEPPITRLASTLVDGFRSLFQRPVAAACSVLGTIALWGATIATCAATMAGFEDMPIHLDLLVLNWTATVTALALIPTPGFVGSWEAGSVGSLLVYDVPEQVAQAYSLLNHALLFLFSLATGVVALFLQGRTLQELVQKSQAQSAG